MNDRADWLEQRKLGVGGSDIASLFSLGYGCQRRLWYQKRSTPEDFPRETTKAMKLGTFMEPFFADMYAEETGRVVFATEGPVIHPSETLLRVNVDRVVINPATNDRGILEIKSQGREAFYRTKREGLADDYSLQLQAGMLASCCSDWGAFAIGNRDNGELIHFDVARDKSICKDILAAIPPFWAKVENGPAPDALEPDDKRCQRCEYRTTCQGAALIQIEATDEVEAAPELAALVAERQERKALLAEAESLVDETEEELKAKLGDRQAVRVTDGLGGLVYFRPQAGAEKVDGKGLLTQYRTALEVLASYTSTSFPAPEKFVSRNKPSRPLRIF